MPGPGCPGCRSARPSARITGSDSVSGFTKRRSSRSHAVAIRQSATSATLPKAEDIEHSAFLRDVRQVAHHVGETPCRGAVARVEISRNDGARPSAHARENGDVLMPVGPAIRDRLADDSGACLVFPEEG